MADKSSSLTDSYLAELKDIAKLSGADFEKLLLDELSKLQKSTKPQPEALAPDTPLPAKGVTDLIELDPLRPQPYRLSPDYLIPPEVQKVVVEHVIRTSDRPSSYQDRVRLRPPESDYDTWRSNVEFLLTDITVPDKHTVRKIMESLLPPAAHIVEHLGPKASPQNYLSLLDSAYDTVDDRDELFARFLSTNQNSGEKPSSYLRRLQTVVSKVVKRGGIPAAESEQQLLKQFCRGCWNNALITSRQPEEKKNNPPSFSDMLLLLRTEEVQSKS